MFMQTKGSSVKSQIEIYKEIGNIYKKVIRLESLAANKISKVNENDLIRKNILELEDFVFNLLMASRPHLKLKGEK